MSAESIQTNAEHYQLPKVLTFEITPELIDSLASYKRGEPLGWGATPLDPHHPDIKDQQESVRRHVARRFEHAPEGTTHEFADMMSNANQARLFHRLSRNHDNFGHRVQWNLAETPELLQETQYRALTGNASPAEVIVVATQLGVPAYELTSLTRPYGEDLEEPLIEMRQQNKEAIAFAGGISFENPEMKYSVKRGNYFHSGDNPTDAEKSLLITRTITIGQLDEATRCYERSSFILMLSNELFDTVKDIRYDDTWSTQIEELPGFLDYVAKLLKDDEYSVAVPSSVTAFVVNDRLIESQINDADTYLERNRFVTREALRTGDIQTSPTASDTDLGSRFFAAARRLTQR